MPEVKKYFAPVPARAQRDKNLRALDHRVLQAIASKDRMKSGGRHCFARQSKLAELVGCTVPALSKSISHLVELGYIERLPQLDLRRHAYRVLYNEDDNLDLSPTDTGAFAHKKKLTRANGDTCSPEQIPATEVTPNLQPKQAVKLGLPAANIYSTENLKENEESSPSDSKSLDAALHALAVKFGGLDRLRRMPHCLFQDVMKYEVEGRLTEDDVRVALDQLDPL